MNYSKKFNKSFKPILILVLVFYTFFLQSFVPSYSIFSPVQTPSSCTCVNGKISCTNCNYGCSNSTYSPVCKSGIAGCFSNNGLGNSFQSLICMNSCVLIVCPLGGPGFICMQNPITCLCECTTSSSSSSSSGIICPLGSTICGGTICCRSNEHCLLTPDFLGGGPRCISNSSSSSSSSSSSGCGVILCPLTGPSIMCVPNPRTCMCDCTTTSSSSSSSSSSGICNIPCGNICCQAGQVCRGPLPCAITNPGCGIFYSCINSSSSGGLSCTSNIDCPNGGNLKCPEGTQFICNKPSMQCIPINFLVNPCTSSSTSSSSGCACVNGMLSCRNCNPTCRSSFYAPVCMGGIVGCFSSNGLGTSFQSLICAPSTLKASKMENNVEPYCESSEIKCDFGNPACPSLGEVPICGSKIGLLGELEGAGCFNEVKKVFTSMEAFCTIDQPKLLSEEITCNKTSLCKSTSQRFKPCRNNLASCECQCQFKLKKHTPLCKSNIPSCSNGTLPVCSNPQNEPVCQGGIILCADVSNNSIDLLDFVNCN